MSVRLNNVRVMCYSSDRSPQTSRRELVADSIAARRFVNTSEIFYGLMGRLWVMIRIFFL
jgi:hypothetical protein